MESKYNKKIIEGVYPTKRERLALIERAKAEIVLSEDKAKRLRLSNFVEVLEEWEKIERY